MFRNAWPAARLLAALALAAGAPRGAGAAPRLVDERLRQGPPPTLSLDGSAAARVLIARADAADDAAGGAKAGAERGAQKPGAKKPGEASPGGAKAEPGSLDFDLLGEAKKPAAAPDAHQMKLRRQMLTAHQASGLVLLGLQLSATALGQLNYNDKFGGSAPANTGEYRMPHAVLSYATVAAFVATGTLALLAPSPVKKERKMDRVMVHRIAMFTAAAGMAAQVGLGIYTAGREGYIDQQDTAQIHLAIGYATLAAVATGVAALAL